MRLVVASVALVLGACSNNPTAAPTVFPPQPSQPVNVAGNWLASWGFMSGSGHFCGATATLNLTQTASAIGGTYSKLVVNCDAWTGDPVSGTVTGTVSGYDVAWDLGSSNLHQIGVFLNGNPTVATWKSGAYAPGDLVYDPNDNLEKATVPQWVSGTYAVGDVVLDSNGNVEQCTVGGTTGVVWAPGTYAVGDEVYDSNNNIEQVTAAGTTGATAPTWNKTVGGTTTDGTVTWQNLGPRWNTTVGGTTTDGTITWKNLGTDAPTGSSAPAWNTTVGGTTTDGTITWKNLGSRFQLTGTSVWANTDFQAMGIVPPCGNAVANADPKGCADTLAAAVGAWAPGKYAVGDQVFDSNDNIEQCTVAGTTGVVWASGTYAVGDEVYDSNNNIEQVTVAGTTGATAPTWNTTVGGTTSDGTVTWKNLGARWNATSGGTTTDGTVTWKSLGSRFLAADTATIARIGSNWVGKSH